MRNLAKLAAVALLALAPVAAQAQSAPAAGTGSEPQFTREETENFRRGLQILGSFNEALRNEDVPPTAKAQLFMCLYTRTLAQISIETGKVFAADSSLDPTNRLEIYRVAAGVCGLELRPVAADRAGSPPAPSRGN